MATKNKTTTATTASKPTRRKYRLTVGDLRKAIANLPDDAQVCNDTVGGPKEWVAGIVSFEAGIPKAWQGVQGAEAALWFHVRIRPLDI